MSGVRKTTVRLLRAMMERYQDAGPAGRRLRGWLMRHGPGMVTCGEFEQFIHDYQEGWLRPQQRRVFDLHMELCPMCRAYFTSYLRAVVLGKRLCDPEEVSAPMELPEELVSAILAARRAH